MKKIAYSWDEGRYLDFWSIVHIITAIIGGGISAYFDMSLFSASTIFLFLIVIFEIVENTLGRFINIKEHLSNIMVDIVIGMIFFIPSHIIFLSFSKEMIKYSLYVSSLILFVLFVFALRARQKRKTI